MDTPQHGIPLSSDFREWPDHVLETLRDCASNPHIQAWAAGELSKRAAVNNLSLADVMAAMDAKVQEDDVLKQSLEHMQRVERRRRVPSLKQQAVEHAKRLCRYLNAQNAPAGFREAGELLKRYCRQEITGQEFVDVVNGHLKPKLLKLRVDTINERNVFSVDEEGWRRADGWQYLAQCVQEGVILLRFRICLACDQLFFDRSNTGNKKKYCYDEDCQHRRKRDDQQRHRARPQ